MDTERVEVCRVVPSLSMNPETISTDPVAFVLVMEVGAACAHARGTYLLTVVACDSIVAFDLFVVASMTDKTADVLALVLWWWAWACIGLRLFIASTCVSCRLSGSVVGATHDRDTILG